MSDAPRKPTLDDVVRDVRRDSGARGEPDWAAMEDKLFARIDVYEEEQKKRPRLGRKGFAAIAGALALAAGSMLVLGQRGDLTTAPVAVMADPSAGALRAVEGSGQVIVGGQTAAIGRGLARGEVVEAAGARGLFENPGKVTFAVEDRSRAKVERTNGTIVLSLEAGAVEAQVVPVAKGEAFAVDVVTPKDVVRVAVHGTHLRVARDGDRVVVDLTEGVVSIGRPPREGSTYGTLIVAPAHVELDATRLDAGVTVDHAPEHVRKASSLAAPTVAAASPAHVDDHEPTTPAAHPSARLASATPRPHASEEPATSAAPTSTETAPPPSATVASAGTSSAPRTTPKPKDAIVQAVRACVASRVQLGQQGVRVTVSSTLHLRVGASGAVESARFDPPLEPEVQSCAAATIYATRFAETGAVTIPIEVGR